MKVYCGFSQFNPDNVCRVENGRTYFKIDLRWNVKQRKEIMRLFDLDSLVMDAVYKGQKGILSKNEQWEILKLNDHIMELSKVIKPVSVKSVAGNDVFMVDDRWISAEGEAERESVDYGVNKFTSISAFSYKNGVACFFLRGHKEAKKIFISGSFNSWSTVHSPMQVCDSGWIISMRLRPGKYSYKYILDGNWSQDPYNRLREDDTYGGYNSLVFCYNRIFRLRGYQDAHKVIFTGSFNNWNEQELRMIKISGSWMLNLYLREGTYTYKFIVDNNWITDPENKLKRPDGKGNYNSVIGFGDSVEFRLKGFRDAKKVMLAGNFNNWNTDEVVMEKTNSGWQAWYVLGPGNYEYKFIVDGKWMIDPANPNTAGTGDYTNSFISIKPNHIFYLDKYQDAKTVMVAGSFNYWVPDNFKMIRKDGKWIFPIYLKPGKYTYKFVVDNKWIIDPGNELWENNEYGTGNSVLWIEP